VSAFCISGVLGEYWAGQHMEILGVLVVWVCWLGFGDGLLFVQY